MYTYKKSNLKFLKNVINIVDLYLTDNSFLNHSSKTLVINEFFF